MSAPSSPAPIADSQSQTQEYTLQPSLPNHPIDGGEVEPEDPTEINVDGEGDASQEGDDNDEEDEDAGTTAVGNKTPKDKANDPTKKRERKAPAALEREPGKSLFPFSRVQKIIRADKVCLESFCGFAVKSMRHCALESRRCLLSPRRPHF